jgi:hypothetical protein
MKADAFKIRDVNTRGASSQDIDLDHSQRSIGALARRQHGPTCQGNQRVISPRQAKESFSVIHFTDTAHCKPCYADALSKQAHA